MPRNETAREYTEAETIVRNQFKKGVGNIRPINSVLNYEQPLKFKQASLSFQVNLDDIDVLQDAFVGGFPKPDRYGRKTDFVMLGRLALVVAKALLYDDILRAPWKAIVDEWEEFYAHH